jgi:hypothetical protein
MATSEKVEEPKNIFMKIFKIFLIIVKEHFYDLQIDDILAGLILVFAWRNTKDINLWHYFINKL